jgi:hypothetical protein
MTTRNITSGFKATGLVPFDPDQVLSQLGPVVETMLKPLHHREAASPLGTLKHQRLYLKLRSKLS